MLNPTLSAGWVRPLAATRQGTAFTSVLSRSAFPACSYRFTRCARPLGQPAVVTPPRYVSPSRRVTFSWLVQRESTPGGIRPCTSLRYVPGSRAPSARQGHALKGHPWPFRALAASMPLNLFHTDSTRPTDRTYPGFTSSVIKTTSRQTARLLLQTPWGQTRRLPVRRPSGGVAQGGARHGRRARSEGTGTSLRDGPQSGTGATTAWMQKVARHRMPKPREVERSEPRTSGGTFFCLLFFAQTKNSKSPCKVKPVALCRGKRCASLHDRKPAA